MHPLLSAAVTFLAGWTACSLLYIVLLLVDALASFSRIGTVRKATANLWGATTLNLLRELLRAYYVGSARNALRAYYVRVTCT